MKRNRQKRVERCEQVVMSLIDNKYRNRPFSVDTLRRAVIDEPVLLAYFTASHSRKKVFEPPRWSDTIRTGSNRKFINYCDSWSFKYYLTTSIGNRVYNTLKDLVNDGFVRRYNLSSNCVAYTRSRKRYSPDKSVWKSWPDVVTIIDSL